MSQSLKLLAVLAHPDDESFGIGSTLAKYASEGVETYLVCATRGERGRYGEAEKSPGMDIVGKAREEELHNAANILGIKEVSFLDYIDGCRRLFEKKLNRGVVKNRFTIFGF